MPLHLNFTMQLMFTLFVVMFSSLLMYCTVSINFCACLAVMTLVLMISHNNSVVNDYSVVWY